MESETHRMTRETSFSVQRDHPCVIANRELEGVHCEFLLCEGEALEEGLLMGLLVHQ